MAVLSLNDPGWGGMCDLESLMAAPVGMSLLPELKEWLLGHNLV